MNMINVSRSWAQARNLVMKLSALRCGRKTIKTDEILNASIAKKKGILKPNAGQREGAGKVNG